MVFVYYRRSIRGCGRKPFNHKPSIIDYITSRSRRRSQSSKVSPCYLFNIAIYLTQSQAQLHSICWSVFFFVFSFGFSIFSFHARAHNSEMHCIRESFIVIDVPFSPLEVSCECYVHEIHSTIPYEVIRKVTKTPDKWIRPNDPQWMNTFIKITNQQKPILFNTQQLPTTNEHTHTHTH